MCGAPAYVAEQYNTQLWTLHHAQGREFEPWWWQNLYWTQAQQLQFLHDSFGLFNLKLLFVGQICHVNYETKMKNTKFVFKTHDMCIAPQEALYPTFLHVGKEVVKNDEKLPTYNLVNTLRS